MAQCGRGAEVITLSDYTSNSEHTHTCEQHVQTVLDKTKQYVSVRGYNRYFTLLLMTGIDRIGGGVLVLWCMNECLCHTHVIGGPKPCGLLSVSFPDSLSGFQLLSNIQEEFIWSRELLAFRPISLLGRFSYFMSVCVSI